MKYQAEPYSCGAAAVVNALRCLGHRVSEVTVRSWAGTDPDHGTDEVGIRAAIHWLGYIGSDFELTQRRRAMNKLRGALAVGSPVIISTQNAQHWVTVAAALDCGKRFLVIDPVNTAKNLGENGIHVLSARELLKTWRCRDPEFGFYGIICRRKT
jgi:ABC-type bacteriocin/lantibiotic exporter with double-glycine peptidase domain